MKNWMLIVCPVIAIVIGLFALPIWVWFTNRLDGWGYFSGCCLVDHRTHFDRRHVVDSDGRFSAGRCFGFFTSRCGLREQARPVDAGRIHAFRGIGTKRCPSTNRTHDGELFWRRQRSWFGVRIHGRVGFPKHVDFQRGNDFDAFAYRDGGCVANKKSKASSKFVVRSRLRGKRRGSGHADWHSAPIWFFMAIYKEQIGLEIGFIDWMIMALPIVFVMLPIVGALADTWTW